MRRIISRRACLKALAAVPLAAASDSGVDLLLRLDLRTGDLNNLVPGSTPPATVLPGSLVKPFTALAYAATHAGRFPDQIRCTGCWGGRAHGEVDFVRALAVSCNRYFEELSLRTDPHQMSLTAAEYGLATASAPPDNVEARIGLGTSWRIAPRDLLAAYSRIRHPAILEGLRLCARSGTAKAIGANALAKTGTASCEHSRRMPGDGLAIALWPPEQPRSAILVREHGVPGAIAARRLKGLVA